MAGVKMLNVWTPKAEPTYVEQLCRTMKLNP